MIGLCIRAVFINIQLSIYSLKLSLGGSTLKSITKIILQYYLVYPQVFELFSNETKVMF